MIQITSLKKKFHNKDVLNNINLTIEDGSIFGIIGPNGSGKSTLLKLIAGILKQDEGSLVIDNACVFDNSNIKKDILLISDEPFYFMNASLKTMKEFYHFWYPQFDLNLYDKYLKLFKFDENKMLKNCSKGMKRQAFIILALAISPKYLLLDEAFDGLDPVMRLLFKRAITECIEEKQMTVIISSHNLHELENICDSYGLLENCILHSSGQIFDVKQSVHKIQIAFSNMITESMFSNFDLLSITIQSRVANLIIKGDIKTIQADLQKLQPLMLEILPVNLEEIFLYEMEKKGYGVQNA